MNDLRLSLVMKFVDQFTGPLRRARGDIRDAGNGVVSDEERRARQVRAIGRGAIGVGAAIMTGLGLAAREAANFEEAMKGVEKVTEFESPDAITQLAGEIRDLSTEIPMLSEEIAAIVEAAAQANLVPADASDVEKIAQLRTFAEEAGKIGTAFDQSAEQAAAFMTSLRARMQLTQAEAMLVADAVNHLSQKSGSSATNMTDIISRVGGLASSAGYSATEIAALSAAFDEASPSAEIAATAFAAFLRPLTAGEAATKAQSTALEALGMTAEGVAARMQVDASGVAMDIVTGLQALPAERQGAIRRLLVGDEGDRGLATIVNRVDRLKTLFDEVADPATYEGSVMREYETAIEGANAQWTLMMNTVKALMADIGDVLLPFVTQFAQQSREILSGIREWAKESDNVAVAIAGITVALGVLGVVAMFNPVLAAIAGISALVVLLIAHWDDLKAKMSEVFDWIVTRAAEVGAAIRSALTFEQPAFTVEGPGVVDAPAVTVESPRSQITRWMGGGDPPRAIGGGVRAGQTYQWQEEGLELFAPMTDGRVISNAELGRMGRGAAGGGTVTIGDIHVHAQPGQSAVEVARAVRRELAAAMRPRSPLHDGGVYG